MSVLNTLLERSNAQCELCTASENLEIYALPPQNDSNNPDTCILACGTCRKDISQPNELNTHHWHCLNDSIWSQVPAVQVIAWRMLNKLATESWAQNLLAMMYLDDETRQWAESETADEDQTTATYDSHGTPLNTGDTVTLIKDLPVKGAGFTAKRGTAVRGISLTNNPKHIEGRVNGVRIVLLTKYLKKS